MLLVLNHRAKEPLGKLWESGEGMLTGWPLDWKVALVILTSCGLQGNAVIQLDSQ